MPDIASNGNLQQYMTDPNDSKLGKIEIVSGSRRIMNDSRYSAFWIDCDIVQTKSKLFRSDNKVKEHINQRKSSSVPTGL
jgi:hypothetical protein